MDEHSFGSELSGGDFGRGGTLPEAVRAKVRGRRTARRVRTLGAAAVLALCAAGFLKLRPAAPGTLPDRPTPQHASGAIIGIDDPMFEGLDGTAPVGSQGARDAAPRGVVWRAGLRRNEGLSLDI